jgi:protein-S-isoprenylcysteine O-methyltransferase
MRLPFLLGLVYFGSELLLTVTRRSRGTGGFRQDRSTLRVIWVVILASIAAGIYVAIHWRAAALPYRDFFIFIGLVLFVMGLVVRWWAIIVLGRFFTVDVTIAKDHQLVESGPYRLVRHPSYTGVLLAFLGLGLSFANWATFLVLVIPIFAAFLYRMNVEEQALSAALGEPYAAYMRRTKRLVPGVY